MWEERGNEARPPVISVCKHRVRKAFKGSSHAVMLKRHTQKEGVVPQIYLVQSEQQAVLTLLCNYFVLFFFADFQPLNRYMFHIKGLPHAPASMHLPSIHFVVQPVQSAHVSIHVGKHHVHKYIINLFPRPLQIGETTAWE